MTKAVCPYCKTKHKVKKFPVDCSCGLVLQQLGTIIYAGNKCVGIETSQNTYDADFDNELRRDSLRWWGAR